MRGSHEAAQLGGDRFDDIRAAVTPSVNRKIVSPGASVSRPVACTASGRTPRMIPRGSSISASWPP
jgi:hypothetical protein